MNMTPRFQRIALLSHITFSVGWFGAVVPYLALAIAGLVSQDARVARGAYLSMAVIGWTVIVPLSVAALLSGLIQSLGTRWGLFRHWWVVGKFGLTVVAVVVLLRHMQDVSLTARLAGGAVPGAEFRALQIQLLLHPTGGLLTLFAAMTLSVFKPWGLTEYGRRRTPQADPPFHRSEDKVVRQPVLATSGVRWTRIVAVHAVVIATVFAIMHIAGLRQ